MKLAVCASGEGLNAETDVRFGRCSCFVIVDTESGELIESLKNSNVEASGGAGVKSAQMLYRKGVDAVVVGNLGPKAEDALKAARIAVYGGLGKTVAETAAKFKEGKLEILSGATVPPHSGAYPEL